MAFYAQGAHTERPQSEFARTREPNIYGSTSLDDLETILRSNIPKDNSFFQTNHEGEIPSAFTYHLRLQSKERYQPRAWTHTSVAIRDALIAINTPLVEVHISNVHAREAFRRHSYVSDIALAVIAGCGIQGYAFALETLNQHLRG